jgi:hypothetical protein
MLANDTTSENWEKNQVFGEGGRPKVLGMWLLLLERVWSMQLNLIKYLFWGLGK